MRTNQTISTLTERGQTTVPTFVRKHLGGKRLAWRIEGSQVVVSNADSSEHEDPVIRSFLGFIEHDMAANKNVRPLPAELLAEAKRLTAGMEVDLDAPLE